MRYRRGGRGIDSVAVKRVSSLGQRLDELVWDQHEGACLGCCVARTSRGSGEAQLGVDHARPLLLCMGSGLDAVVALRGCCACCPHVQAGSEQSSRSRRRNRIRAQSSLALKHHHSAAAATAAVDPAPRRSVHDEGHCHGRARRGGIN